MPYGLSTNPAVIFLYSMLYSIAGRDIRSILWLAYIKAPFASRPVGMRIVIAPSKIASFVATDNFQSPYSAPRVMDVV